MTAATAKIVSHWGYIRLLSGKDVLDCHLKARRDIITLCQTHHHQAFHINSPVLHSQSRVRAFMDKLLGSQVYRKIWLNFEQVDSRSTTAQQLPGQRAAMVYLLDWPINSPMRANAMPRSHTAAPARVWTSRSHSLLQELYHLRGDSEHVPLDVSLLGLPIMPAAGSKS